MDNASPVAALSAAQPADTDLYWHVQYLNEGKGESSFHNYEINSPNSASCFLSSCRGTPAYHIHKFKKMEQ